MSVPDNGHVFCIVYLGKWQMRAHLESIQKDKFTGTGLTLSGGLSSSAAATGFPSHLLFQKVAPSPTKGGVTGGRPLEPGWAFVSASVDSHGESDTFTWLPSACASLPYRDHAEKEQERPQ